MADMERPGEWVSLQEARRRLRSVLQPLEPVAMSIHDAVGRVLAEPVTASADIPPYADSAMDGYALRAADTIDTPVTLEVVGDVRAGAPAATTVAPGQSMAIATGGVLPDGADAVCMVEAATRDGDKVVIEQAVEPGTAVRPAGDDIACGATVFDPGTRLGPAHIGVLASLGIARVAVHPAVRVGVLATGDELIDPPATPAKGQIYDANRPALLAACRRAGHVPVDLGIIGDDPKRLESTLTAAAGSCDLILTSGGVSVGVADHAKAVLGRLAPGTVQWMEVQIKPGKPFGFAVLGDSGVPVLCLPGNPVSALVVFALQVRPALALLTGESNLDDPVCPATAAEAFPRRSDGKVYYVRARATADADGRVSVAPAGPQGSHQLHTLARANALAIIEDGDGVKAGDPVPILPFDDGRVSPAGATR